MLFIVTESGKELTWHTGTKTNWSHDLPLKVVEVQADGHELEKIHSCGFPNSQTRSQRFFGDQAKWIVANVVLTKS